MTLKIFHVGKVNIVPIIAKADSLTMEDCSAFKQKVFVKTSITAVTLARFWKTLVQTGSKFIISQKMTTMMTRPRTFLPMLVISHILDG